MKPLLLLALLCFLPAAHAVESARQSADGTGGCPVTQGEGQTTPPAAREAESGNATATPSATRTQGDAMQPSASRQRGPARWQSLVPGMFR